ncbi:hypothetical protein [Perigonia lusca single nucleopolyhedrovirus]|uniref:Uncharacterized protein n=1 Tax=Perigonia lusca single nucleopolyhedrovirus TaxID=1675865 RepID=A0A0M3WNW4_9ABAC|nr:hypothetical protein [Perigonia lusca single nucleopolyhedrovirus]AKN80578.1 hypothetical protein [Perigonia lusca single nucleopolyhedrovirus]
MIFINQKNVYTHSIDKFTWVFNSFHIALGVHFHSANRRTANVFFSELTGQLSMETMLLFSLFSCRLCSNISSFSLYSCLTG